MSKWPNVVTIGSFVSDQDVPGDFRLTTMVDGWGSPARRMSTEVRTGRHGVTIAGQLYAERTIVHEGLVECSTAVAANDIANELAALAPGVAYDYVVSHEALSPLACSVDVAVGANPEWIDDRSFTYSLTLVAADPFKRALSARTTAVGAGSSVPLTNDGTAAAHMLVTLTSGGTVVLTAGGVTLTTDALPAGAVIDTASTSVTADDGTDLMHLVAMPPLMPMLPAGGGSGAQAGTAALSIETFDTYA